MGEEFLRQIIAKWGRDVQINKIQEEAIELALVLNQRNCPTKDPVKMEDELYGELADMKIMMAQAEIIFCKERIDSKVKEKLKRCKDKYFNENS